MAAGRLTLRSYSPATFHPSHCIVAHLNTALRSGSVAFEGLADFQGPALLVYNDATFSEADFESISRIGEGATEQVLWSNTALTTSCMCGSNGSTGPYPHHNNVYVVLQATLSSVHRLGRLGGSASVSMLSTT